MRDVLGHGPGTHLYKALTRDGISTVPDLISMSPAMISELYLPKSYDETIKSKTIINKGDKHLITLFSKYIRHHQVVHKTVINNFAVIARDDFDEYRTGEDVYLDLSAIRMQQLVIGL